MKIKKIISSLICAAMCLSIFSINASAASNSNIDITKKGFDKSEAYNYYQSHISEDDNMIVSSNTTRGTSEPTTLWRLDDTDYYYSGSVTETPGASLYTSYYFLPTTDGKLYVEGYAKISEPYYDQNMNIYLKDMTAGTVFTVTLGENEKILEPNEYSKFTLFYYNYRYNNLNPQHSYCLFFNTVSMPTFYDVNGYIAHNWTNKLTPEM